MTHSYAPVTIGRQHLSEAYLDDHAAEIDALSLELTELRVRAAERSGATLDGVCSLLATLLTAIEDGESAIDCDAYKAAKAGVVPLSEAMSAQGVVSAATVLLHKQARHNRRQYLWSLSCYLTSPDVDGWPLVHERAEAHAVMVQRVEMLEDVDAVTLAKYKRGLKDHLATSARLSAAEAKN